MVLVTELQRQNNPDKSNLRLIGDILAQLLRVQPTPWQGRRGSRRGGRGGRRGRGSRRGGRGNRGGRGEEGVAAEEEGLGGRSMRLAPPIESAVRKLTRVGLNYNASVGGGALSEPLPPVSLHCLKFQTVATWEPRVQTREPMENPSRSNHKPYNYKSLLSNILSFIKFMSKGPLDDLWATSTLGLNSHFQGGYCGLPGTSRCSLKAPVLRVRLLYEIVKSGTSLRSRV